MEGRPRGQRPQKQQFMQINTLQSLTVGLNTHKPPPSCTIPVISEIIKYKVKKTCSNYLSQKQQTEFTTSNL